MAIKKFTIDEARKIGNQLDIDWDRIDIGQFLIGMNVELEHGLINIKTNVTNDNALLTGKIALAHLEERSDYYSRLELVESGERLDRVDPSHYYGNLVRQLFFVAAAVMLVGLPFVRDTLAMPTFFSIVAILILDFLAALANPKQGWVQWVNTITSALALVIFEFFAVRSFESQDPFFFVVNQFLALLFLVALYFNTKTLRAMILK